MSVLIKQTKTNQVINRFLSKHKGQQANIISITAMYSSLQSIKAIPDGTINTKEIASQKKKQEKKKKKQICKDLIIGFMF